jgi:hypothetical protein
MLQNLDTEAGSPAEEIYKKWGYVVVSSSMNRFGRSVNENVSMGGFLG